MYTGALVIDASEVPSKPNMPEKIRDAVAYPLTLSLANEASLRSYCENAGFEGLGLCLPVPPSSLATIISHLRRCLLRLRLFLPPIWSLLMFLLLLLPLLLSLLLLLLLMTLLLLLRLCL